MQPFTDVVLVEIDGPDVVTCHLAYDPLPQSSNPVQQPGPADGTCVDTHWRPAAVAAPGSGQREKKRAVPGTRGLSENTPDEVSYLDRW